ncbi:hypothetical protein QUF49_06080 [Fictibacillus sp. b24]|uniref:hypothetical protein n=1 Tax=Fictibacillus sp. b24 TaxID=3055863 RepID=UPI0025A2695B|nr:hypothetical protein [Fictibacillus sp. b24]MDM5315558.1 hypothetical protein [Fictibacillus sp. b24]
MERKVADSYGTSCQVETPNGAKRQEAHRSPHGKRATWSGNQLLSNAFFFNTNQNGNTHNNFQELNRPFRHTLLVQRR